MSSVTASYKSNPHGKWFWAKDGSGYQTLAYGAENHSLKFDDEHLWLDQSHKCW